MAKIGRSKKAGAIKKCPFDFFFLVLFGAEQSEKGHTLKTERKGK